MSIARNQVNDHLAHTDNDANIIYIALLETENNDKFELPRTLKITDSGHSALYLW